MNPRYRPREMMGRILTALGFAVAFAMVTLFIYPRYGLAFSLFIMLLLTIVLPTPLVPFHAGRLRKR